MPVNPEPYTQSLSGLTGRDPASVRRRIEAMEKLLESVNKALAPEAVIVMLPLTVFTEAVPTPPGSVASAADNSAASIPSGLRHACIASEMSAGESLSEARARASSAAASTPSRIAATNITVTASRPARGSGTAMCSSPASVATSSP